MKTALLFTSIQTNSMAMTLAQLAEITAKQDIDDDYVVGQTDVNTITTLYTKDNHLHTQYTITLTTEKKDDKAMRKKFIKPKRAPTAWNLHVKETRDQLAEMGVPKNELFVRALKEASKTWTLKKAELKKKD